MQDDGLPRRPPDKLLVAHGPGDGSEVDKRKDGGPSAAEIEAAMADRIRADSVAHSAMTLAEEVFALVPGLRRGEITPMLEEMAADERYADIKAVTTDSGNVFFFSKRHIGEGEAFARSRLEESMLLAARRVRADSGERNVLTPEADLLGPDREGRGVDLAALAALPADGRYADIRKVTTAAGDVCYHSTRYVSGGYAALLCRAASKDPCATIAETVREDSKIYPRATNIRVFGAAAFGVAADALDGTIEEILRRAEFSDIRRIVHPATGGTYLYSDRYLTEPHAVALMDWEEVGKEESP